MRRPRGAHRAFGVEAPAPSVDGATVEDGIVADGVVAGAASGGFSGPLMPQPAIAAATSGTATSVARRRIVREARRKSRNIGVDVITHIAGEPERTVTTESTFLAAADATLAAIGASIDRALEDADTDLDWNLVDGILEIACEDGSKVIVNRHAPNREIWVAARRGGFHFRGDGGRWRDARGGGELGATLSAILREQAGLAVAFGDLAAPDASG